MYFYVDFICITTIVARVARAVQCTVVATGHMTTNSCVVCRVSVKQLPYIKAKFSRYSHCNLLTGYVGVF